MPTKTKKAIHKPATPKGSTIIPFRNKVQIELMTVKAGRFVVASGEFKIEKGLVKAVGKEVKDLKVGDVIYVKAWAIDIIKDGEKEYGFCTEDSDAICAIIK